MKPRQQQRGRHYYIWDAEQFPEIDARHFDPEWWAGRDRLSGQARGRGTVAFVETDTDAWVLRHYHRGGYIAKVLNDHYLWLGLDRSRAFREWRLLAYMHEQGLPVPRPVAAKVQRSGASYTADLVTQHLPNTRTLAQDLRSQALPRAHWQKLGELIARFHKAGIFHHDLNAHNVLRTPNGEFSLIDFDKGRRRAPGAWCEANRKRLHRSLNKLAQREPGFNFSDTDWQALLGGYLVARAG